MKMTKDPMKETTNPMIEEPVPVSDTDADKIAGGIVIDGRWVCNYAGCGFYSYSEQQAMAHIQSNPGHTLTVVYD
jgi:hypothetical protein